MNVFVFIVVMLKWNLFCSRNMKNVIKLSEQELTTGNKTSWHDQYRSSAWIFVGGFPYELSEGDIICVFSQYGEIVNINLIRDKKTGKQKGFCFLCYEDQRSTVLAVDNLNGIKVNQQVSVNMIIPLMSVMTQVNWVFSLIFKKEFKLDRSIQCRFALKFACVYASTRMVFSPF